MSHPISRPVPDPPQSPADMLGPALCAYLAEQGVGATQLEAAGRDDRLGALLADSLLGPPGDLSEHELVARSGIDVDFLRRWFASIGVPRQRGSAPTYDQADLETVQRLQHYLELGLPAEGMLRLARTLGLGLARVAAASTTLVQDAMLTAGQDDPQQAAVQYATHARALTDLEAPVLAYVLRLHLRQLMQSELIGEAERRAGNLPGGRPIAVAFVDLVGFTRLGEEAELEVLGEVADRLAAAAVAMITPPVTLVKTIGDAVMLVSADIGALLDTVLALVATMEDDGTLPARAGVAFGPALASGGDWFGRPVNLASRVTAAARAGSVLVDGAAREAAGERRYRWSPLPPRGIKGVAGKHQLHRVRPAGAGTDRDPA